MRNLADITYGILYANVVIGVLKYKLISINSGAFAETNDNFKWETIIRLINEEYEFSNFPKSFFSDSRLEIILL